MGYTHYWRINRPISKRAMALIVSDTNALLAANTVPLAYECDEEGSLPVVTADLIRFNGVGEDGHETFYLTPHKAVFEFCKTACKPYDKVVTAVLIVVAKHAGKAIEVTSDGEPHEWSQGFDFVRQVLGGEYAIPLAD